MLHIDTFFYSFLWKYCYRITAIRHSRLDDYVQEICNYNVVWQYHIYIVFSLFDFITRFCYVFVRSRIDSHGDYRRIVTTANFHYQSNRCRRDDVEMWRCKKQRQHLFNEKLYQWHEDIIHYAILYMYLGPSKHVFGTKFWNDRNILVFGTTDQHGTSRVFGPKISGILDRQRQ